MGKTITNNYDLPEWFVDALQKNRYKVDGDISLSQLLDSPQIRMLKKTTDYDVDISEQIAPLIGSGVHYILEQAGLDHVEVQSIRQVVTLLKNVALKDKDRKDKLNGAANWLTAFMEEYFPEISERYMIEQTFSTDIDGWKVYGTLDIYDKQEGILWDCKTCSVWDYKIPANRKKWVGQTNSLAYMLREKGYPVNEIKIMAVFRDWSKSQVERDREYPPIQAWPMDIQLYTDDQVYKALKKRVNLHRVAENGGTFECSPEEMWSNADEWVVKVKGGQRALPGSKCDSEMQAEAYMAKNMGKYNDMYIEYRPGERRRCEGYCPLNKVCPQYKEYINKKNGITT